MLLGLEKGIWRLPGGGIYTTAVGYCGGFTKNPRYDEVCSGRTGHTEGVQVVYDPKKISFVDILRWFWEAHDPTQGMGQGHDRGTQYRSGFYWFDDEQKELVERSARAYQEELTRAGINRKITTEMKPASDFDQLFYYAEEYHQQYLAKPGIAAVLLSAAALDPSASLRPVGSAGAVAPRAQAHQELLG